MSLHPKYFITGIDTDSGKTLAAAILTEKLSADYWKPIQAGTPTDSSTVRAWVNKKRIVHPEGICLQAPLSPHAAAKAEHITLKAEQFVLPQSDNTLIIEGAGGVMVPINQDTFVIDLAQQFEAQVILVSRNYLGSINHTLLSIAYLMARGFDLLGIIFNDTPHPESEKYILNYSGLPCIGRIEHLDALNPETIKNQTKNIYLP